MFQKCVSCFIFFIKSVNKKEFSKKCSLAALPELHFPLHNCDPDWHYSDHLLCPHDGTPEHQSSHVVPLLPLAADSLLLHYVPVCSLIDRTAIMLFCNKNYI